MSWINVKNKLPKEEGCYLVNIHQEDDELGESADFVVLAWYRPIPLLFCDKSVGWSLLNEFYDLTEQLKKDISHWMPLPNPPTEEKE